MRGGMATESPPRYKGKPDLAIAGQPSRWPRRLGVSLGINGGGLGSGCEAAWGARRVGRAIEITVHPVVEGLPVPCDLDTSIKGALRAGHLKRAKRMPNIRSGCGNRDRWEENEVLIPVKKIDSQRPLLDALIQTSGSERAFDLYMKARSLHQLYSGHGSSPWPGSPPVPMRASSP